MFNLIRRNPMREMTDVQRQIDRFFSEPLFGMGRWSDEGPTGLWYPSVDMFENDEALVIKAELPGLSKDDIVLNIESGTLTLSGERKFDNEVKEEKYYRRERAYGKFTRRFSLPANVDSKKITAEFKEGVLKIEIPKPEEQKPKKIAVH